MPNLSKEKILMKFDSLGAKLINARYQHISLIKNNIDNGENIKTILIEDIDFKLINIKKYIIFNKPDLVNKEVAYCFELPFEILTFNSHVDVEKMYIISSDVKISQYKLYVLIHQAFLILLKN